MSKIFCIGEMLIDFISQDGINFTKNAGGAPANVSVVASRLGCVAYFLGQVGSDSYGTFLKQTLIDHGVDVSMLKEQGQTTMAFVSVDDEGERDFEFRVGSDQAYTFDDIDKTIINADDVLHFGSATAFMGNQLEATYYQLLEFGKEQGNFISFDPNYRADLMGVDTKSLNDFKNKCFDFIEQADLVKLSRDELFLLTQQQDIRQGLLMLRKTTQAILIVTLGAQGSLVLYEDEFIAVDSIEVVQKDATGAGDAFVGSLLIQIASHKTLNKKMVCEFVKEAKKIGAINTTKFGELTFLDYLTSENPSS